MRMAAATRARVDAPSFCRYPSICLCTLRISEAVRIGHVGGSKPNASGWKLFENRGLRIQRPHEERQSVQSLDIRFMSFVGDSHTLSRTENRTPEPSARSIASA